MSTQIPTLKDLFAHAERRDGRRLPAPPPALAPVLGQFEWQGICDKALDLLDISIFDVLLGAWKKHAELRKQVRASAADPAKAIVMNLGAHHVESEHRPSMEIRYDGRVLATLTFPVEVTLDVEAAQLTLQGGTVNEIRTGVVKARGTVKLENTVILERALEPIQLPGKVAVRSQQPRSTLSSVPLEAEPVQSLEEYVLLK